MTQRTVGNRQILGKALLRAAKGAVTRPREFRYHAARELWVATKRFGAESVTNVELRQLPAINDAVVETYVDDPNRGVLAALCKALECKTFFEIGTNRGRTTWTVARNNPALKIYTLDLPSQDATQDLQLDVTSADLGYFERWDRGIAFAGTPEEERIERLYGDTATFDFSPYAGAMDLVYIDAAHSYNYVKNDSEAALQMLAHQGVIAWDDYPTIPGIWAYLTELSPSLDRSIFHIYGTRLAVYSSRELYTSLTESEYAREIVA